MTLPDDVAAAAAVLRSGLVRTLTENGVLSDENWRKAAETVPRHDFIPGFYQPGAEEDEDGLTIWEPVTAEIDHARWLSEAYSDTTLITQFDGEETDWSDPHVRHGGTPTSSATLPSLVMRMWADADISDHHTVLEIGTGTGYSTALACERLGSDAVTSVEVDGRRLDQAAAALHRCGYAPTLAAADGQFGYWPSAPVDRIVAGCSFRVVPPHLVGQLRPGGKALLPLSGWMYGYARVLLTMTNGMAAGPLLPGTISFMTARADAPPMFGNPSHWAAMSTAGGRLARHNPDRITAASGESFHLRFLAQCAVPKAQMTYIGDVICLVDVATGSVALLTPQEREWRVRETGPVKLWQQVEHVLDSYEAAGRPGPETFTFRATPCGQYLQHPQMPTLPLS